MTLSAIHPATRHVLTTLTAALAALVLLTHMALAEGLKRPETLADTAKLIQNDLRQSGDFDEVRITEDHAVEVVLGGVVQHVLYPDNLHNLLRNIDDADDRRLAFDEHMSSMTEAMGADAPKLSLATLDRVYPVLRHESYGAGVVGDQVLLRDEFLADLSVFYVLDSPKTAQYLTEGHLADSDLTLDLLKEAAGENLSRLTQVAQIDRGQASMLVLDGYYESSLVLDKSLWRELARGIPNMVMIVPARDLVVFGDANIPDLEASLRDYAVQISGETGGLTTDRMFRWSELGWIEAD